MIEKIINSVFWDPDKKKIKIYDVVLKKIIEKEEKYNKFSKEDIKNKTLEFKKLFEWLDFKNEDDSKKIKQILENIKVDAFAIVKQACKIINWETFTLKSWKEITWNMIPYDVQLIWWLAIHDRSIAEMKTWEWKTLVATLPAYLNALTWNTVHIVTVNDYLANRDANEMWILYNTLWLTVWVVTHNQNKRDKKENYSKDVVYATNNELWFDYLRDNMVTKKEDKSQSNLFFAIIDEVDSILVDEARTPLIISMPDSEPTTKYLKFATLANNLDKGIDYKIDEKQKAATLTEVWIKKIEDLLWIENIYISNHYNDLHHIENAIKARWVFQRDKDYIIADNEVLIVDEHTWRVLSWRRYSDWLHQALEAKEKVEIKQESKTLASITFQNYFRMYWKLSGMTGTAKTEEEEFYKVYALDVLCIPTNKAIGRKDEKDLLFKNEKWKFKYVVKLIKEIHETGQPILVWTVSVDKSEYLSDLLKSAWVKHNVLNAKHHANEADIISNAWQKGAITIATNMAWRWTDIKLGEWVVELGWLIIIWTEKHETRRIDNQLRWRAWRQWDPWSTQYLVTPNDDIMRIFGWDKLFSAFNSPLFASLPDDEPLAQSGMLTKKITSVQKQVEWHNFDIRKHILEYDDIINEHRNIIYNRRNKILDSENIDEDIILMIKNQIKRLLVLHTQNWEILRKKLIKDFNLFLWIEAIDTENEIEWVENLNNHWNLENYLEAIAIEELNKIKEKTEDIEDFYSLERRIVLSSIDDLWMRHIDAMSRLREEVAFEWYAQKNPLLVYKWKAYEKFHILMNDIEYKVVKAIFTVDTWAKIEQIKISEKQLEFNESELDNMLNGISEISNDKKENNSNPLFASPKKENNNKTRIRI